MATHSSILARKPHGQRSLGNCSPCVAELDTPEHTHTLCLSSSLFPTPGKRLTTKPTAGPTSVPNLQTRCFLPREELLRRLLYL